MELRLNNVAKAEGAVPSRAQRMQALYRSQGSGRDDEVRLRYKRQGCLHCGLHKVVSHYKRSVILISMIIIMPLAVYSR